MIISRSILMYGMSINIFHLLQSKTQLQKLNKMIKMDQSEVHEIGWNTDGWIGWDMTLFNNTKRPKDDVK